MKLQAKTIQHTRQKATGICIAKTVTQRASEVTTALSKFHDKHVTTRQNHMKMIAVAEWVPPRITVGPSSNYIATKKKSGNRKVFLGRENVLVDSEMPLWVANEITVKCVSSSYMSW